MLFSFPKLNLYGVVIFQFEAIITKIPALVRWHDSTVGFWIDVVLSKTFVFIYFGYCMIPFGLLKWRHWTQVYGSIYYNGTILFVLFPIAAPYLKRVLVKRPPRTASGSKEDTSNKNINDLNATSTSSSSATVHNGKQD